MTFKNAIHAAIAVLMIGSGAQATAAEITVNASTAPGYLSTNNYVGNFDASSVLPGMFTIESLTFSFTFADDASDSFSNVNGALETTTATVTENIPGSGGDKKRTVTTTKTTPVARTGQKEAVSLQFGAASFGGETASTVSGPVTVTSNGAATPNGVVYEKNGVSCVAGSSPSCQRVYKYTATNTATRTTTTDYSGNFGVSGSLLGYDTLIASFLETRVLNFGLGVTGDLNLLSASITVNYTEVAPAAVPEPGSLALFGIGLLGFARLRRNRRV